MNENIMAIIADFLEKAVKLQTRSELKVLEEETLQRIDDSPEIIRLMNAAHSAVYELICVREKQAAEEENRRIELSETERSEILMVQRLIDDNLFTYHFQPIIRADNGEIYSYEALMRAKGMQGITPFHILKYAELSHRLGEVEQYTFINVLHFIGEHPELFNGRKVFINSMPNVRIDPVKVTEIEQLLEEHSGQVVVEMTENSEFSDQRLEEIKEKFRRLGIPIAIDDFGTGYSNISNLLRYKPNYVKIDRSLLSGIQDSPNKRHFVREIIDFCHDNDIMALAEGIESSEELRTVILMGVDLIQGFYTARPSAEVLTALPYELRAEIKAHRQEREDGQRMRVYHAAAGEKVSLERLRKEGYSKLIVGTEWNEGHISVSGSPLLDTGVHIETVEGFKGRITLDNAHLSNQTERPCIDIGEGGDVTLILIGDNRLTNSGVRVPETSKLTLEGNGDLSIVLGSADYYGIGNDLHSSHGELVFDQDGTVSITAESHSGVCIGSGLGGLINIRRGRYVIRAMGALSIGIGSADGPTKIDIIGCDLDALATGAYSVAMGSMNGDLDVHMMYSSIKCRSMSQLSAGIGTLHKGRSFIHAESVSLQVAGSADSLTAIGSLDNESDITISRSGVKVKGDGSKALVFGSVNGGTRLHLTDVDLSADMSTELKVCAVLEERDVRIVGGRYRVNFGSGDIDRLVY